MQRQSEKINRFTDKQRKQIGSRCEPITTETNLFSLDIGRIEVLSKVNFQRVNKRYLLAT